MPLFWPLFWNVISISSLILTWLKDTNLNFWPRSLMGEGTCFQVEGPLGARSFSQVLFTSAWFFWSTQRFQWHTAKLRDGWSGWFKLSLGVTVWLFVCWPCNERPAHPGCALPLTSWERWCFFPSYVCVLKDGIASGSLHLSPFTLPYICNTNHCRAWSRSADACSFACMEKHEVTSLFSSLFLVPGWEPSSS